MTEDASATREQSIIFSPFRLDTRGGQLTRAGIAIPLRPKTWAVLLHLVERPGMLVSKDELLDSVWGDVAVTPDTLTKSIGELRVALGDDAKTPRFIETVHRRGFRFIGQSHTQATDRVSLGASNGSVGRAPFVGRAAELERLHELGAKAARGERQVVFVTGSAGVGKTTLVEAFLDSEAFAGPWAPAWIGRGGCVDQHGPREAYMPVLEALGRLAQRSDADALLALMRRVAPTWLAQMPWLMGDDAETIRQSLQGTRAERMLREFAVLTERLTADVLLVLVLEDLHWSDPSTVDLLSLLGQRREPARMLIIGTYRAAELVVQEHVLSKAVRTLQMRRQCVELPVHDLTPESVRDYLEARFPGAQPPPALAHVLHAHTDGNPLFVTAVVEHILSRGWVIETNPGWSFTIAADKLDLGVPDDARRVIAAQVECLSPADRALLSAASVAGNVFAPQAITSALRCELDDVEMRCETWAQSQRFLRFAGSSEWADGTTALHFAFTHELYRQSVYEAIPAGHRQRLHQRIGETLATAFGDRAAEIAGELAFHFERAGDYPRALRQLRAAATCAVQRFAGREAISYLEAAIALTERLPDERERGRRELELRIALAPLLNDLCGFASEELRQNCLRAYALSTTEGSAEQRFQILYALCHVHVVRGDSTLAPATIQQLDALARQLATPEHRLMADSVWVRSAGHQGHFTEVCRMVDGRLAPQLRERVAPRPPAYGADPVLATHTHHAYALWFLGHTRRAKQTMHASLAASDDRAVSPFSKAAVLALSAVLELLCRNAAQVRQLSDRLGRLAAEHSFAFWAALAAALRGWAQLQDGDLQGGIAELEAARDAHLATGAGLFSTHILAFLAEGRLRAGELSAGLKTIELALRAAEETTDRSLWPELWRLKGELLLANSARSIGRAETTDSRRKAGEECLERAIAMARGGEMRSLEIRAATSLARQWGQRGHRAEAAALLRDPCEWFGEDPDNPDLVEARALLVQLAQSAPRGSAQRGTRQRARR